MYYNSYRSMWIMVFFDLPTDTKKQRKTYAGFRKQLIKDGYTMFQFSIYIRNCSSHENKTVHLRRLRKIIPAEGKVGILTITDKQFEKMEIFERALKVTGIKTPPQLEFF